MTDSNNRELTPKTFSFFLVEDEVNPYKDKIFDEIFGSSENYKLQNARSIFSAIAKLNYKLKNNLKSTLYIFDVRLMEKENKTEFQLCFDDHDFRKKLNDFYGVNGFSSYSEYKDLKLDVYNEFKENFGKESERQDQEGFYLWAYNMKHSTKKFRSLIYSASSAVIKDVGWIKESGLLFVLTKSLFDYSIVTEDYDIFLNEIERLSKNRPIKIFHDAHEIQSYENFSQIPEFEHKFVDFKGEKINIHNHEINWKSQPDSLKILFNEKKKDSKLKSDYEDLLYILELCSEDIANDPDEYISWDKITDVDIDTLKDEGDILDFLEKEMGIYNREYWTLRTLFPAQCYRILNEHQDNLEIQKTELKKLIAKYGWNDYAESLSLFFNQGAVYFRVHSLDEYFCDSHENQDIFSSPILSPFDNNEIIDNWSTFKKVWKRQYNELALKIRDIDKREFEHNDPRRKKKNEKERLPWKKIADAFEYYQTRKLDRIRTNYLEYTAEKLFDYVNGDCFIKGRKIPVDFPGGNFESIKLFFPGTYFLNFIEEINSDHIKKNRGEVKKCELKANEIEDTHFYIMSFILLVEGWEQKFFPRKNKAIPFSVTKKFNSDPLLKNFVRFHMILTNSEGEKQIFNINNDFPIDPAIRELKIKGETILDIDKDYADKNIKEIYVFSITSSLHM